MYLYVGVDQTGLSKMSKGGTLPALLWLARRNHRRMGMTGIIWRPDGTKVGQPMRRIPIPTTQEAGSGVPASFSKM